MSKELEELGRQLSRFGIACSTVQLFDVLAAIEKRLDDLKKRPSHREVKALLQRERDHRHRQIAQIDKALSAHRFEDEHGEIEKDLDNLGMRVSNLECPSPMFLDAMNRLHALDGKGNGDIDPPDVVTLSARLDALEHHHHQGVSPPRWWGTLGHEIAKMKVTSEGETADPKPPAVCEGCAEIDDCNYQRLPWHLDFREGDNPSCYVEKDTCGTCRNGLWPLRATRTLGRCYCHPALDDLDKGLLISWDRAACPNYKKLEA
ncbi:hypothetical protein M0R72_17560 [Candidatus Pacearchaeota archaeon]|jgi:hypothetical protein|nr:hypothetical protein [Candidatus Pacearchaeota archaeon]